jgi:cyanophycinase
MTGYIFAIGGGYDLDINIFKRMIEKSKNNRVLLIFDASTHTITNHTKKATDYFAIGDNIEVSKIKISKVRTSAELMKHIFSSGIVYFTGGHQSHLLKNINKFKDKFNVDLRMILSQYLMRGGIVGGTSAGASILGTLMPTGKTAGKRKYNYYIGTTKLNSKIQYVERALGLIPFIVDQHFTEHKRHERGKGMAIDNRAKLVGIDENTAFYQKFNTNRLYKIGKGNITIYDGTNLKFTTHDKNIYIRGI